MITLQVPNLDSLQAIDLSNDLPKETTGTYKNNVFTINTPVRDLQNTVDTLMPKLKMLNLIIGD